MATTMAMALIEVLQNKEDLQIHSSEAEDTGDHTRSTQEAYIKVTSGTYSNEHTKEDFERKDAAASSLQDPVAVSQKIQNSCTERASEAALEDSRISAEVD